MKTKEVWKTISRYPAYEVSNMGRLRSIPRYGLRVLGHKFISVKLRGRLLKTEKAYDGYARAWLNDRRKHQVHRLVAESFIGEIEGKNILHLNGRRSDNRVENLLVVSPAIRALNRRSTACRIPTTKGEVWRAVVWVRGRYRNIGNFNSQAEAVNARNALVDRMLFDATNQRITRCSRA